jgi:hypothetical protein
MWGNIDTAWAVPYGIGAPGTPTAKVYFFSGDEYCRYDITTDRVDRGPLPIAGNLGDLAGPVRGGMVWPNGSAVPENAYMFLPESKQYSKYSLADKRLFPGYPRAVDGNWPNVVDQAALAGSAFVKTGKAFLYFYADVDPQGPPQLAYQEVGLTDHTARGPLTGMSEDWLVEPGGPRLTVEQIDTVLSWPTNVGPAPWWPTYIAYFFFSYWYAKVDIRTMTVMPGYPQAIADGWHGLPMGKTPGPPIDGGQPTTPQPPQRGKITKLS